MNRTAVRALVLLVSSAVALGGGWIAWKTIESRRHLLQIRVVPREPEEPPLATAPEPAVAPSDQQDPLVAAEPKPDAASTDLLPTDPVQWRYYLTQRQAARFFSIVNDAAQVYDPWVYCRDRGNLTLPMEWAEHPDGRFTWRSNSLGCREDHELAVPPADVRVLVAGDSHTCGVCNNAESYANRLEALLASARPGKTVEVLNAGLGGYSFYNYLGTLLRLRDFAPQVLVVGVFAGNDFHELLPLYLRFHKQPWSQLDRAVQARRDKALETYPEVMGQGYVVVDAYRNSPQEGELALQGSLEVCGEIQRTASACGAKLIVVLIPSPFEIGRYDSDKRVGEARTALGLTQADLGVFKKLSDGLLSGLREQGIESVDMRPAFAAEPEPPYWKSDFHLNLRGHELIAKALEPLVEKALGERR